VVVLHKHRRAVHPNELVKGVVATVTAPVIIVAGLVFAVTGAAPIRVHWRNGKEELALSEDGSEAARLFLGTGESEYDRRHDSLSSESLVWRA